MRRLVLGISVGTLLTYLLLPCPARAQGWVGPDWRPNPADAWIGHRGPKLGWGWRLRPGYLGNPSGAPVKVRQLREAAPPTSCGRLFTEVLPRGRVRCFGVDYGG